MTGYRTLFIGLAVVVLATAVELVNGSITSNLMTILLAVPGIVGGRHLAAELRTPSAPQPPAKLPVP